MNLGIVRYMVLFFLNLCGTVLLYSGVSKVGLASKLEVIRWF